jgi:hypothetical protein
MCSLALLTRWHWGDEDERGGGRWGGRKGHYCFDRRDEPKGGTLARIGVESELVKGVCDVCSLGKSIKVGLESWERLDAEVAGGV